MSTHECAICLSPITDNEELQTLPCNHSYHDECIEEWVKTSHVATSDNEIQWQCPLCRHMYSERCETVESEEMLQVFSTITFRAKRCYIQSFTFADALTSFISFTISDNILYILWFICSLYGFCGANNFNVYHLKFYAWTCLFPLTFKMLMFMDIVVTSNEKLQLNPVNDHTIYFFSLSLSCILQVYLIHCIHTLSHHIIEYERRLLRYMNQESH